ERGREAERRPGGLREARRERVAEGVGARDELVGAAAGERAAEGRDDAEAGRAAVLGRGEVEAPEAAAQHGLLVPLVGDADARLPVVAVGLERAARLAARRGEEQAAGEVRAGRAVGGARAAHGRRERVGLVEAEAAVLPVE